jgi:hypothetical protein
MTYSELYEKVKIETEAAKRPFKEYKKTRKTFTELFESSSQHDRVVEALAEEDEYDQVSKLIEAGYDGEDAEDIIRHFNETGEIKLPEDLKESNYNKLYEQFQVTREAIEPLTEQEAIYLVSKFESGEKLTESELQRLEELNTVNWSLGRSIQNGLSKMTGGKIGNTARLKAYNNARAAGKQQGLDIKTQKANAWANKQYGGQVQAGAAKLNDLQAGNANNVLTGQIDPKTGKPAVNLSGEAPAKQVQSIKNVIAQVGVPAAIALGGGLALIPGLGVVAASAATAAGVALGGAAAATGTAGAVGAVGAGLTATGAGIAGLVGANKASNNINQTEQAGSEANSNEEIKAAQANIDQINKDLETIPEPNRKGKKQELAQAKNKLAQLKGAKAQASQNNQAS